MTSDDRHQLAVTFGESQPDVFERDAAPVGDFIANDDTAVGDVVRQ